MQETGLLLFLPLYPAQLTQSVRHYLTEKLIIHPSLPRSKPHLTPTVQMRMPLSLPLCSLKQDTNCHRRIYISCGLFNCYKNANPNLSLVIDPILKQISTAVEHQTNLKAELDNAGIKITGAVQNADSLKTEIDGLIKESLTSTSEVKDSYEATVKNQLENLAGSLGSTGSSVSALLTQLNEGASDLTDITNSASDDLALIHTSLSDSSTLLSNVSEQLSSASEALLNPNRDGLSVLTNLLAQKPEAIAAFLASPVSLSEHPVYPIENYGSAMAPFYSTLAMWVGGVVLAAMLKVNVSGKALTGVF